MTSSNGGRGAPQWTLGDRLRKARNLTGLDQRAFAELLGVSRNTVGNAEADAVAVRKITLKAWAAATGVPLEWLIQQAPIEQDPRRGRAIELIHLMEELIAPADEETREPVPA